ncbi:MAG: hypothetical protein WKF58_07345 [Ilumatobacteraceae bacterium]
MLPVVGVSSPARRCNRVVFPDPEGPIRAICSPAATAQLTPCTATTAEVPVPKVRATSRARTTMFTARSVRRPG